MNEKEMFNQKLEQIGGGEILEGISIRGNDKEKILDFINANTGYQYEIDENGFLKRVSEELKENKNLDGKFKTFLDIELEATMNEKRKIILVYNNEKMNEDLEILKLEDKRIILLNNLVYDVIERFVEIESTTNDEQKIQKDLLYNEELTDRLIKSMYDQVKIVQTRSSRETVATMAQNQVVSFGPASNQYATAGSVNKHESVYILSKAFGYYHIQYSVGSTGQEKQGYVPMTSVEDYSGPAPQEEDYYGGYCYASTELDVRTCDEFNKTAPVGTLYLREGCTMIFHYQMSDKHVAYIEYSSPNGTKRGYVYNQYLVFPHDTCVGVVNSAATVYGSPNSDAAELGALGSLEFVGILAKEGDVIHVEYNTNGGRKRGYIKYSEITAYNRPASFPDFYSNGTASYVPNERITVYGGPNTNYAELGAVRNEDIINFHTNNEYFAYTCIEYTVTGTGKKKRGYVLASKVIAGSVPEQNNHLTRLASSYANFGSPVVYGYTQTGQNMQVYKAGTGRKHLYLIFALHGWEDGHDPNFADGFHHGDGDMLIRICKKFVEKFENNDNFNDGEREQILNDWSIYVYPGINLDGLVKGHTNDGYGRCLKNGLDPNRNWDTVDPAFIPNKTDVRNKTASTPFQAQELRALRDHLLASNTDTDKAILIDLHGWYNQIVGNYELGAIFENAMGLDPKRRGKTYGDGYLINWARKSDTLNAQSCLVELIESNDYSESRIEGTLSNQYYSAILNILRNY